MWSFEILDRVQAERARVQATIAEVERKLASIDCRREDACAQVRALRDAIVQYTQTEDSLLPEALSTLQGWGAEQLAQLEREHQRRRQVLDNAMAVLEATSPTLTADGSSQVIEQLARHTAALLKVLATEDDEVLYKAVEQNEATRYDGFGG